MNFSNRCYEMLTQVPSGRVTTYKAIANALNSKAYRAVGTAMKNNPNAPQVPCHRVVNNDSRIGKYAYGVEKKIELLKTEGINVINGKVVNFAKVFYDFN
ncbi:Methylated-DNA--protein-cysteine methyltransferase [Sulfurovum sp. enrichment culture clone C5]|uniref:Methylated-DNA--protein-cysteine methyltransferase n=1 Tax=Sulfurovum sp. enrichment culture clone C5 TaxID=497650 RepID=A0A0S4XQB1_9BACT|nr:Methylated-DNA--protein-cysteine methyltransferase [Sulfurovum sp. enrichment culture clone C5]